MVPDILGHAGRRPLRLAAVFVLVTGLLLVALATIAWRQIEIERGADADRRRAQAANAAAVLADDIERQFAHWERTITGAAGPGPTGAAPSTSAVLYFDDEGVTRAVGVPLPFYPAVPAVADFVEPILDAAESLESSGRDLPAAESMFRRLSSSADPRLRAAALVRLARVHQTHQRLGPALAAYEALAAIPDASVAGVPANLVAYRARAELFAKAGDARANERERARFERALWGGLHRVDRATFDAFRGNAVPPREAVAALHLAGAAAAFWADWHGEPAGRAVREVDGQSWLSAWHVVPGRRGALVVPAAPLRSALAARASSLGVDITLVNPGDGGAAAAPPSTAAIVRPARETGLPWTLLVRARDPGLDALGARSRTLVAGFALMTLAIALSGYFVFRAVNREVGVARLQSDFVSAVSHEFRSPLTAMNHLTELLERGVDSARLPDYYRALGRETRRLHGLVESLLDFGRIEAGRRTYSMAPVDLAGVIRDVVAAIATADPPKAARVAVDAPPQPLVVSADASALAVVVRNLIDNALNYSPPGSPIRVVVSAGAGQVTMAVEDRGHGLSAGEQRRVFDKFVRGEAARETGVKGTGIGLTMVRHLVAAHGGTIGVDSEPGRGSRFVVVLPVREGC